MRRRRAEGRRRYFKRSVSIVVPRQHRRRCGSSSRKKSAGVLGIVTLGLNGGCNMAIAPTNKREADEMALKLFCLLAFLLVGLITAGVL